MVKKRESGQAVIEYVLLVSMVVGFYVIAINTLKKIGVSDHLLSPLKNEFRRAYQYGHPKAKGLDEGEAEMHPREVFPEDKNFRIFMNPGKK